MTLILPSRSSGAKVKIPFIVQLSRPMLLSFLCFYTINAIHFLHVKCRLSMPSLLRSTYINPVLRLKTRSQTCVGGISHLNLVNWTLDMKNQRGACP